MMKQCLVLALWVLAACSTQAQPYLKQVITFSLTGCKGPSTTVTNGLTLTYKNDAIKFTDKGLCQAIALDNHTTYKSPQLVAIYNGSQYMGLYVMDGGRVVATATNYLSQHNGISVKSGSASVVRSTRTINIALTLQAYDSWRIGSLYFSGMDKITSRATAPFDNPDAIKMTVFSSSAPVSGYFTNTTSGAYGVCSGTFSTTSSTVKTIPGL